MRKALQHGLFALGALAVAATAAVVVYRYALRSDVEAPITAGPVAEVGGPFELVDQGGRRVTDADFPGKHLLVTFGYTYCPDVCPTTLSTISAALDELGPVADQVQPIFITIDPDRDTPRVLADYIGHFHSGFVALSGTPEQIADVAKAYRVYYAKAYPEGAPQSGDDYLMDHSSLTYLMSPDGHLEAFMPHGTNAEAMAARIREYL